MSGLALPRTCGLPLYACVNPVLADYPQALPPELPKDDPETLTRHRTAAWHGARVMMQPVTAPSLIEAHRLTYLVAMEGLSDPLMTGVLHNALAEHAAALDGATFTPYRTGVLVESSLAPADLLERMAGMCRYTRGTHPAAYLNWSDRRVAESMLALCSAATLSAWLGPIARLHVLARNGHWLHVSGHPDETQFGETELYRRSAILGDALTQRQGLRTSAQEHRALLALQTLSRVLLGWEREGHAITAATQRLARDAVEHAQRHHAMLDAEAQVSRAIDWMNTHAAGHPHLADTTPYHAP